MRRTYAIIVPVYNNAGSIPVLLEAFDDLQRNGQLPGKADVTFVFVSDGCPDNSEALLRKLLPKKGFQSKLVVHSRNFGSFAAIRTGLSSVEADYYGMIAADLQEPPELLAKFYEAMANQGRDVVVGRRDARDDPSVAKLFSGVFWRFYRWLVVPDIPKGGVDLFACTKPVRDQLLSMNEANSSLVAQLFWLGFNRAEIGYTRSKRTHGKSGWSLGKKVKYMLDSIFSFTDVPLRLIMFSGALAMAGAVCYGTYVVAARALGLITDPGFAAIITAVLFMGGLNAFALGVVGNYAWRIFENSKARPLSVVSQAYDFEKSPSTNHRDDRF